MLTPRMDAARSLIRRTIAFVATAVVAMGLTTAGVVVESVVHAPPASAATYLGSAARLSLVHPIVDMASTPTGKGSSTPPGA